MLRPVHLVSHVVIISRVTVSYAITKLIIITFVPLHSKFIRVSLDRSWTGVQLLCDVDWCNMTKRFTLEGVVRWSDGRDVSRPSQMTRETLLSTDPLELTVRTPFFITGRFQSSVETPSISMVRQGGSHYKLFLNENNSKRL